MQVSLAQLLNSLVKSKGSDLHLATNAPPYFCINGSLIPTKLPPFQGMGVNELLAPVLTEELTLKLQAQKGIDFSFFAKGIGVCRANLFYEEQGLSAVIRVLPEKSPTLEELGLPEICKTACTYANGLILVAGPTGCGKTTTIAAMINHINQTRKDHILTLEDPIEFRHESAQSMVNQRSLGSDFTTFASALRAALREDPDVIMVGEMRDPETMALAIKASETGHLVFSTLHTSSAPRSINRVINAFPAGEQNQVRTALSEALRVVICQQLVPSIDGSGRICFQEILINNTAVANLIREGKPDQLITPMQTGQNFGMKVLDFELRDAVQKGRIDGREAWEFANDKDIFKEFDPDRAGMGMKVG